MSDARPADEASRAIERVGKGREAFGAVTVPNRASDDRAPGR
jgi:hypothetical protein